MKLPLFDTLKLSKRLEATPQKAAEIYTETLHEALKSSDGKPAIASNAVCLDISKLENGSPVKPSKATGNRHPPLLSAYSPTW